MNPTFFATPAAFRRWLKANHAKADELWVGFYRKDSGKPTITWSQAVDEALCFGWIDGIRKKVDVESYTNRFTPRRRTSTWSAINLEKMKELIAAKRVAPAGLKVYEERDPTKAYRYSFDRKTEPAFTAAQLKRLKGDKRAWAFWSALPPGYRRLVTHFVTNAKKAETIERRFVRMLADFAAGRRLA